MFLIERQILPTPRLYLSAFFEASRRDYYDGFRGVSECGAWNDWLEYFLLGVARLSEDALNRAMRINQLLAQWQKKVSGESRVIAFSPSLDELIQGCIRSRNEFLISAWPVTTFSM